MLIEQNQTAAMCNSSDSVSSKISVLSDEDNQTFTELTNSPITTLSVNEQNILMLDAMNINCWFADLNKVISLQDQIDALVQQLNLRKNDLISKVIAKFMKCIILKTCDDGYQRIRDYLFTDDVGVILKHKIFRLLFLNNKKNKKHDLIIGQLNSIKKKELWEGKTMYLSNVSGMESCRLKANMIKNGINEIITSESLFKDYIENFRLNDQSSDDFEMSLWILEHLNIFNNNEAKVIHKCHADDDEYNQSTSANKAADDLKEMNMLIQHGGDDMDVINDLENEIQIISKLIPYNSSNEIDQSLPNIKYCQNICGFIQNLSDKFNLKSGSAGVHGGVDGKFTASTLEKVINKIAREDVGVGLDFGSGDGTTICTIASCTNWNMIGVEINAHRYLQSCNLQFNILNFSEESNSNITNDTMSHVKMRTSKVKIYYNGPDFSSVSTNTSKLVSLEDGDLIQDFMNTESMPSFILENTDEIGLVYLFSLGWDRVKDLPKIFSEYINHFQNLLFLVTDIDPVSLKNKYNFSVINYTIFKLESCPISGSSGNSRNLFIYQKKSMNSSNSNSNNSNKTSLPFNNNINDFKRQISYVEALLKASSENRERKQIVRFSPPVQFGNRKTTITINKKRKTASVKTAESEIILFKEEEVKIIVSFLNAKQTFPEGCVDVTQQVAFAKNYFEEFAKHKKRKITPRLIPPSMVERVRGRITNLGLEKDEIDFLNDLLNSCTISSDSHLSTQKVNNSSKSVNDSNKKTIDEIGNNSSQPINNSSNNKTIDDIGNNSSQSINDSNNITIDDVGNHLNNKTIEDELVDANEFLKKFDDEITPKVSKQNKVPKIVNFGINNNNHQAICYSSEIEYGFPSDYQITYSGYFVSNMSILWFLYRYESNQKYLDQQFPKITKIFNNMIENKINNIDATYELNRLCNDLYNFNDYSSVINYLIDKMGTPHRELNPATKLFVINFEVSCYCELCGGVNDMYVDVQYKINVKGNINSDNVLQGFNNDYLLSFCDRCDKNKVTKPKILQKRTILDLPKLLLITSQNVFNIDIDDNIRLCYDIYSLKAVTYVNDKDFVVRYINPEDKIYNFHSKNVTKSRKVVYHAVSHEHKLLSRHDRTFPGHVFINGTQYFLHECYYVKHDKPSNICFPSINNNDNSSTSKDGAFDDTNGTSADGAKDGAADDAKDGAADTKDGRGAADDTKGNKSDEAADDAKGNKSDDAQDGAADDTKDGAADDSKDGAADDAKDGATDTKDGRGAADDTKGNKSDEAADDAKGNKSDDAQDGAADDTKDGAADDSKGNKSDDAKNGAPDDTKDGAADDAKDGATDTKDGRGAADDTKGNKSDEAADDAKDNKSDDAQDGAADDTKDGAADDSKGNKSDDAKNGAPDDTKDGAADDTKDNKSDDDKDYAADDAKGNKSVDGKDYPADDAKGNKSDDAKDGVPDNAKDGDVDEQATIHETQVAKVEVLQLLMHSRTQNIPVDELNAFTEVLQVAEVKNHDIVIAKYEMEITYKKMSCLRPGTWLNDEVINFYMNMLQDRDKHLCELYPTRTYSHFFSSFFIERLLITDKKYKFANVAKWTKKLDIFSLDKIFFPINLDNIHWTLAVVFMKIKEIHYYDSLRGCGDKFLNGLRRWLIQEAKVKKRVIVNPDDWQLLTKIGPQQTNGFDCGVFTTICADYLSDDLLLDYDQSKMLYFREKMGTDIMRGRLLYPEMTTKMD